MDVSSIRLEQIMRFEMKGSALKGTMNGRCLGLETHLHVETDEPPDRVRELVRMGEQTCFTLSALTEHVPSAVRVTMNGEPLGPGA